MTSSLRILLICNDLSSDTSNLQIEIGNCLRDKKSFLSSLSLVCVYKMSEAFEALQKQSIDMVLLDMHLKGFSNLDALLLFRQSYKTIPLIAFISAHENELGNLVLENGAQDYLVKGILDARSLARSMTYCMEKARLFQPTDSKSEERFRYMIDHSVDGMIVIDESHEVRFLNPAAEVFLNHNREQILGQKLGFPLSENQSTKLEIPLPDGQKKIAEVQVAPIEWENKKAFLLSITDVTELMRLEKMRSEVKERRRLDKLKDDFISTVSHELRTPLTIVKAAISNLKEGVVGPLSEKQEKVVDITSRNVDRLARLINDLLDLSRLESGFAKMNRRRLNVLPVLQELVASFQDLCEEKNISLELVLPSFLPMLYADPDLIQQVLSNLLNNALRYAKSKIVLRAVKLDREDVRINIEDDGEGIDKTKLTGLFSKFVQINRPVGGEGYKGTGLGLAICKEIVEHHNGQIGVESAKGMGSCFYFTLPRYDEELDYELALQAVLSDAKERGKRLALMVLRLGNIEKLKVLCDNEQIFGFMGEVEECLQSQVLRREDSLISHPLKSFVIVLAETNLSGASSLQLRIEKALSQIKMFGIEGPVFPEFKFGIAIFPDDTAEMSQILDLAIKSSRGSL